MDVGKNTKLTELFCFDNLFTGLDLSQNAALSKLYCDGNVEVTEYDGEIIRNYKE